MNEVWKPIEGYEDYLVSNLGRVKSLKFGKEKILSPGHNGWGYLDVGLCKNGQKKHQLVHRLVALAFIPNPKNLPEVNHKNEDKTNNRADNLEWVSSKENINYGTRTLRAAEKLSKKILQFTLDGTFIREWPSLHEIKCQFPKFNIGNICSCCLGHLKTAHKYIWRYA